MTEPTKEQLWKEEARKAYQDQQSQDSEGGCRESIGFVQGYLAAKKSRFEETKTLKEHLIESLQWIEHTGNLDNINDTRTCYDKNDGCFKCKVYALLGECKENKENRE